MAGRSLPAGVNTADGLPSGKTAVQPLRLRLGKANAEARGEMTAPGIACHIVYCLPADVSREVQELEHDIGGFIHREEVRRALAVVWDLAEFGPGG